VERIAAACRERGITLPEVRSIYTGGGPVFPRLLDALAAAAPNAAVASVYGSTEAEPIALLPAAELSAQDRARLAAGGGLPVGCPVASIALRIVPDRWGTPLGPFMREEFEQLSLPRGQAGEIVVSGAHVLGSYLDGAGDAETKIHVQDGPNTTVWHRTGDAGYLDEGGRLWLLGRCAARIDDGGENAVSGNTGALYPFTVECAVREMPGVRQAALIAFAGRRVLVLELEPGNQDEVASAVRKQTAWARIDEVRVLARVPVDRRHNAKIDYPALRRLIARR
jgi:acyl-CoA synthetase (AMP-forming)/AMP-acid ligase II